MKVVLSNVSKSYGTQKAVDDLSFSVSAGEVLGFLGPNGAGKTTTMKMITNYMQVEEGDIQIGNLSVIEHGEEVRKHIGYLPEHNPLYLDMPVVEFLYYMAGLQGVAKPNLNKRTLEMIGLCGLNSEKHKKINELSKGYRQRVGLAQAMIHDPEVLILDEPTTGLDPNQIVEIRKLIKDIGREKTVILSTHILPEVEATCDRILIINRGRIVADGTPESLKRQASGMSLVKVKIGNALADVAFEGLLGLVGNPEHIQVLSDHCEFEVKLTDTEAFARALFELCAKKQWYISGFTSKESSLEDIFRGLTI